MPAAEEYSRNTAVATVWVVALQYMAVAEVGLRTDGSSVELEVTGGLEQPTGGEVQIGWKAKEAGGSPIEPLLPQHFVTNGHCPFFDAGLVVGQDVEEPCPCVSDLLFVRPRLGWLGMGLVGRASSEASWPLVPDHLSDQKRVGAQAEEVAGEGLVGQAMGVGLVSTAAPVLWMVEESELFVAMEREFC